MKEAIEEAKELLAAKETVSANKYRKALEDVINQYESDIMDKEFKDIHSKIEEEFMKSHFRDSIKIVGPPGMNVKDPQVVSFDMGKSGYTGWATLPLPPIGIEPQFIWQEKRFKHLKEAINRYMDSNSPLPKEWITEWHELLTTIKKHNQ